MAADPICWWCQKPVPERTILHVADIPGVAAIFGHRKCFLASSYNQPLTVGERIAKLSNGSYVHEECAL